MKHGKYITTESFHNGQMRHRRTDCEESLELEDAAALLNETVKVFDLLLLNRTDEVNIMVKRNKDGRLVLVKKHKVA